MIECLLNDRCLLGENPLWNGEEGCLYWADIDGGTVHRLHLATARHEVIYRGMTVGGFTFQTTGDLLLFRTNDIALLRLDGSVEVLRDFLDEGTVRFNDVIADPEGRVFAGTIGRSETSGRLFRVDRDGSAELIFRGTGCSNGMGFSPDLRTFYWTCSTRRRIFAFDYDCDTGGLSNERVFYQANDTEGIPDGLTVDREGHVWSARWDGYSVVRHAPDGAVVATYPFPVAKVSSLCFGGPALDEFFVTTAGGVPGSERPDGSVYRWAAGVSGPAEFRSRIQC